MRGRVKKDSKIQGGNKKRELKGSKGKKYFLKNNRRKGNIFGKKIKYDKKIHKNKRITRRIIIIKINKYILLKK